MTQFNRKDYYGNSIPMEECYYMGMKFVIDIAIKSIDERLTPFVYGFLDAMAKQGKLSYEQLSIPQIRELTKKIKDHHENNNIK